MGCVISTQTLKRALSFSLTRLLKLTLLMCSAPSSSSSSCSLSLSLSSSLSMLLFSSSTVSSMYSIPLALASATASLVSVKLHQKQTKLSTLWILDLFLERRLEMLNTYCEAILLLELFARLRRRARGGLQGTHTFQLPLAVISYLLCLTGHQLWECMSPCCPQ